MRLCLGYYARGGFSGWGRKEQEVEPYSLEITDTGKWRLRHGHKLDVVADSLFPRPMRFREVWKKVGLCATWKFFLALYVSLTRGSVYNGRPLGPCILVPVLIFVLRFGQRGARPAGVDALAGRK